MSSHWLKTRVAGRVVEVQVGWDRQAARYYGVVAPIALPGRTLMGAMGDGPTWYATCPTLDALTLRLRRIRIALPTAVHAALLRDRRITTHERSVEWDSRGNVLSIAIANHASRGAASA